MRSILGIHFLDIMESNSEKIQATGENILYDLYFRSTGMFPLYRKRFYPVTVFPGNENILSIEAPVI